MGELVNLRQVKKSRARAEAAKRAEENRAKFGQSKADKTKRLAESRRLATQLDQAKLDGAS